MDDLLTLTQVDTGVRFFHESDELSFFEWLGRMSCVESFEGNGVLGLVVRLKSVPSDDDLRELLAFYARYGVDMRPLSKFETTNNRHWFRDRQKYWYGAVFGPGSGVFQP